MEMMIVMTNIQNARKIAVRKLAREKNMRKKSESKDSMYG